MEELQEVRDTESDGNVDVEEAAMDIQRSNCSTALVRLGNLAIVIFQKSIIELTSTPEQHLINLTEDLKAIGNNIALRHIYDS